MIENYCKGCNQWSVFGGSRFGDVGNCQRCGSMYYLPQAESRDDGVPPPKAEPVEPLFGRHLRDTINAVKRLWR